MTHESNVPRGLYLGLGIFYFLYFVAALVLFFIDDACGFNPESYFDPRDGGASGEPGYGAPELRLVGNISVSLILSLAFLAEMFGMAYAWRNESYDDQLTDRLVTARWITWTFSQSLAFVIIAYLAGASNVFVITSVAIATVALNFAQSTNEALHCGKARLQAGQTGTTYLYGWRIEGWVIATLMYAYIVTVCAMYMYTADVTPGDFTGVQVIVWIVLGIYFILHLLILGFTNKQYPWNGTAREWVFLGAQFIILVTTAIGTHIFRSADCIP